MFYIKNRHTRIGFRILYGFPFVQIGRLFLYLYYLHRIVIIFEKSAFNISIKCYNVVKNSIIVSYIVVIIIFISVIVTLNELLLLNRIIVIILVDINLITDVFWGIFLAIQFIKRLYDMIQLIEHSSDKKNFKYVDTRYKYIFTKLTILTCITSLSTIITVILTILEVWAGMIIFDNLINSLCLILSFHFLDNTYKFFCCFCRYCFKCF